MRAYVDVGLPTLVDASPPDRDNPRQNPDDGYPAIIQDQRHGYGCESVDEVEDHWIEHLHTTGVEMTWTGRQVVPYINRGRWLTDCPGCNAGNWAWDRNPYCCCMDCGLLVKVMWQLPAERAHAIRVLAVRELVHQNWNAHKGETVQTLEFENRWHLGSDTTVKGGLVVPVGLDVPDALAKYVDPKVA